jgi:diguanylate cyclase (GGDEF)-like protein
MSNTPVPSTPVSNIPLSSTPASNVFDRFTQRRPAAARRVLSVATLTVLTVPAATILAIVTGRRFLAEIGVFASILFYATGYAAAAVRNGRQLRAAVAEARRDPLTGLPTRAVADEMLDAATRDATPVTVALADIDGLHAINTNLGHAAGDQYITTVARRLSRAVPAGGCLVRQGGDEFTLIAAHVTAEELATAIGAAMAGPAVIAGYRIQPRASVGIAATGGDARYARACADAAMYTAKAAGGNHIIVYQPDRDGQPEPDGTRPLIRRRDLNPPGETSLTWRPTPGDDLLPLLLSLDEASTVHQALCAARDRWADSRAHAQARTHNAADTGNDHAPPATAAQQTTKQISPNPVRTEHINIEQIDVEQIDVEQIDVEPTPAGYRTIACIAEREWARYARLADRIAPLIKTTQFGDGSTGSPSA